MTLIQILISVLGILLVSGYLFLFIFNKKLTRLEQYIGNLFVSRTNSIPALYESSKPYLTKHSEIFSEALRLKKKEFSFLENGANMVEFIETE